MNDEILKSLREQREQAMDQRTAIKRRLEDLTRAAQQLNDQVQEIARQRRELGEPYKVATERVADLTDKIEQEERRRQEEEAAARAVAEAERRAAEVAAAAAQEEARKAEAEKQVITADDVGELTP